MVGRIFIPGSADDKQIRALLPFNDGSGPALCVAGEFAPGVPGNLGGVTINFIARWDGLNYSRLGNGMNGQVYALATMYDNNNREILVGVGGFRCRQRQRSLCGGAFNSVGGVGSWYFSAWNLNNTAPIVQVQPIDVDAYIGQPVEFSVTVHGSVPLAYQWRRNSHDLANDSRYNGVASSTLQIISPELDDSGAFDVIIANHFGLAFSIPAQLIVHPPCNADISGDFLVDINDLMEVINAWGLCSACEADINNDRMVNVDDLLTVINTWGPCP